VVSSGTLFWCFVGALLPIASSFSHKFPQALQHLLVFLSGRGFSWLNRPSSFK
jgi:hypothetical protein